MNHSRVNKVGGRLRLGPGGLLYIVVTGLILGAAIYTQANLLFWSFGLMIGGLVVSLLLSWQTLRAIHVQRLMPSHGVCGEPLVLRYHLVNRSWLPVLGLMVQESWGRGGRGWKKAGPIAERPRRLRGRPHGWVLHLGPHQAIQAEATCWPTRRGLLRFEKIVVSTSFPFGIIRKIVEFRQPSQVLVYPHLYRMNRRILYSLSHFDPSGRKQVERGGGTEEFFGIRQYRVGDSLKLIDWKRTARTGEMAAREMTQPSPPRVMILLDLNATSGFVASPRTSSNGNSNGVSKRQHRRHAADDGGHEHGLSNEERAISLAASLVCDAHFHGYQVGLVVTGIACATFPVHHSLPHRTRILEALAGLDLTRSGNRSPSMTERPSVVVWPGPGDAMPERGANAKAAVLGAAELETYVHAAEGGGSDLLRRRARSKSRREELDDRELQAE